MDPADEIVMKSRMAGGQRSESGAAVPRKSARRSSSGSQPSADFARQRSGVFSARHFRIERLISEHPDPADKGKYPLTTFKSVEELGVQLLAIGAVDDV